MARHRRRRRRAAAPTHRPVEEVAGALGYRFRELHLLEEALTHGSYSDGREGADYERLEFLGDAALGLVVTEAMHFQRPGWSGQQRQETKSDLVSNQSLARAARALSLDRGIRVGAGRQVGAALRSSDRILANVFEAVLGAAYLDGGVQAARMVIGPAIAAPLRRRGLDPAAASMRTRGAFARVLARVRGAAARTLRRLLLLRGPEERGIGYTFARPGLLRAALAAGHRAGNRGLRPGDRREIEALRFLGRDVIHLAVTEALHDRFPEWDEGRMTLARMRLKEPAFMERLSHAWSLGGGKEAAGVAEAVLGSLYLDGRLPAARRALADLLDGAFLDLEDLKDPDLQLLDPKTRLQNRLAQQGREPPRYEVRKGGRNRGAIVVNLRLDGRVIETGRGRSLKEAEKNAARRVFARLYERPPKRRRRRGARSRGPAPPPSRQKPPPASQTRPKQGKKRPAAPGPTDNPKGALQELLVKKERRLPVYRVISESGPEHDKTFVVAVLVGGRRLGKGSGPSKRKAEASAAEAALAAGV